MTDTKEKDSKEKKKKIFLSISISAVIYIVIVIMMIINKSQLEEICYFSQIYSAIFMLISVAIALMQYIDTSNEQLRNKEKELKLKEKELFEIEKDRIQKAIDLANYYKDNILKYMLIIQVIYEKTGINNIIKTINFEDMVEFDIHELEKNLKSDQREIIKNIVSSKKFVEEIAKNSILYGFFDETKQMNKEEISINSIDIINKCSETISNVLNNIEYFAMNFTHGIADESVVYQSLHTTYMEIMKLMYYDIARNNKQGEDKLYTNAIELFNIWKDKIIEQRNEVIEKTRNVVSKGSEVKIAR